MGNKALGDHIKKLRTMKGLNISEAAELTGISQPYLSQVESGDRKAPSNKIIKKLSEALEADYYELLVLAGKLTEEEAAESRVKLVEAQQVFSNASGHSLIEIILDERPLYINSYELSPEDKQRILNVLKELFPRYYENVKE